ncbi:MAG: hypothetical protein WC829_06915 [Hyphomicrobium sp.]
MTVRNGLCKGGPLDGKTHAEYDSRRFAPKGDAGFYVYVPAAGATPPTWRWIENKESKK